MKFSLVNNIFYAIIVLFTLWNRQFRSVNNESGQYSTSLRSIVSITFMHIHTYVYYACNNYCIEYIGVVTISRINYNSFSEIPSDDLCRRAHIETVLYFYYNFYNYFLFFMRHVSELERDRT